MNVTRIMSKGGTITIKYETYNDSSELPDKQTLESSDMPVPAFSEAFNAMKKHLLTITEHPKEDLERLHMVGVDIKHTGDYMSAMLYGTRDVSIAKAGHDLKSAWFGWDTASENQTGEKNVMPEEMAEDLQALIDQAQEYLNGERSQQVLQFDAEEEDEPIDATVGM